MVLILLVVSGCVSQPPLQPQVGRHLELWAPPADAVTAATRLADAEAALTEVAAQLRLPLPAAPLTVWLFPGRYARDAWIARHCPARRGAVAVCCEIRPGEFGIALAATDPAVTAARLRHELAHYVLAATFPQPPPWLDEGLAEWCEAGPPYGHVPAAWRSTLLDVLARRPQDALRRLVALPPSSDLSEDQYRLAWGLTCLLRQRDPTLAACQAYLRAAHQQRDGLAAFAPVFGREAGAFAPLLADYFAQHR